MYKKGQNYEPIPLIPFLLTAIILFSSCKKFVQVQVSKSELLGKAVFENAGTANAASMTALANLGDFNTGIAYGLPLHTGLYGDELINHSSAPTAIALYRNAINSTTEVFYPLTYWRDGYKNIHYVNSVIEGCEHSSVLTQQLKDQLTGESKFVRALWYFYLVNLFGEIPIITTTDYRINNVAIQQSSDALYAQITKDLLDAKALLQQNYIAADGITSSPERIRPNAFAASALLSRAYLFAGDFINAEIEATHVLANTTVYDSVPLADIFLKNSKEAILQIAPAGNAANQSTVEGMNFILVADPTSSAMSSYLLNSFEPDDNRKKNWVGKFSSNNVDYFYPFKYKVRETSSPTEYSTVLRVAELYLIRAEARLKQGNTTGCLDDLNLIRIRAGLPVITATDPAVLANAIIQERRIELFAEWGHRWFDMNRYGITDQIMIPVCMGKQGDWQNYKKRWPIPQSEINLNPKLSQNDGYEF